MSLETELRDRFATAADALPEPEQRLDSVVGRGTRRRRASQLVTALAILAVVGGGAALLDANLSGRAAPVVGNPTDESGVGMPAPSPVVPVGFDDVIWPSFRAEDVVADADRDYNWLADPAQVVGTYVTQALEVGDVGTPGRVGEVEDVGADGVSRRATYDVDAGAARIRVTVIQPEGTHRWYVTGAHADDDVTFEVERGADGLVTLTGTGAPAGGLGVSISVDVAALDDQPSTWRSLVDETADDGTFTSGPFGSPHRTDLPAVVSVVLFNEGGVAASVHTTKLAGDPTAPQPDAAGFDERYRWVVWPVIGRDAAVNDHRPEGFQGGRAATAEALVRDWYPEAIGASATALVEEPDGDGMWVLVDVIGDEAKVAVLVEEIDGTYWVLHAQSLRDASVTLERLDAQRVGFSGDFPGRRDARVRIEQSVRGDGGPVASRSVQVASFGVTSADRWAHELPLEPALGTVRITVTAPEAGGRPLMLAARDADVASDVAGPFVELPEPVAVRLASSTWFGRNKVWVVVGLLALALALAAYAASRRNRHRPTSS